MTQSSTSDRSATKLTKSLGTEHLTLFPDVDAPWGLWCANPPTHPESPKELSPKHFQFSKTLTSTLEDWLTLWEENFYHSTDGRKSQRWRFGFHLKSWIEEGDRISVQMERETEFLVDRLYQRYIRNPFAESSQ